MHVIRIPQQGDKLRTWEEGFRRVAKAVKFDEALEAPVRIDSREVVMQRLHIGCRV